MPKQQTRVIGKKPWAKAMTKRINKTIVGLDPSIV
jgi:hypothetical protein